MEKIGFDLDGVLYPWHEIVYEYYKLNNKTKSDYDTFWTVSVPNFNKLELDFLLNTEILYGSACIRKPVLSLLCTLSKLYEIFYVTARTENLRLVTESWLRRNHLPSKKNLYMGNIAKKDVVEKLGIDYFVEDRLHIAEELSERCKKVFLIDKPWNKGTDKFIRLYNIEDLYEYLVPA